MNTISENKFEYNASMHNSVRAARASEQDTTGIRAKLSGVLQKMMQARDRIRSEVQTMQAVAAIPVTGKNPFFSKDKLSEGAKGKYEALLNEERLISAEVDACTEACTLADSTDGYEMAR